MKTLDDNPPLGSTTLRYKGTGEMAESCQLPEQPRSWDRKGVEFFSYLNNGVDRYGWTCSTEVLSCMCWSDRGQAHEFHQL